MTTTTATRKRTRTICPVCALPGTVHGCRANAAYGLSGCMRPAVRAADVLPSPAGPALTPLVPWSASRCGRPTTPYRVPCGEPTPAPEPARRPVPLAAPDVDCRTWRASQPPLMRYVTVVPTQTTHPAPDWSDPHNVRPAYYATQTVTHDKGTFASPQEALAALADAVDAVWYRHNRGETSMPDPLPAPCPMSTVIHTVHGTLHPMPGGYWIVSEPGVLGRVAPHSSGTGYVAHHYTTGDEGTFGTLAECVEALAEMG